nr:glycerol kinase GlpK [Victivallis sp. Marseille-Q1083]
MMKQNFLMALDQGTTSSRTLIFDRQLRIVGQAQQELPQYYPHPGWVEHDVLELLESQFLSMEQALRSAGLQPEQIAAIGIANQRETTVIWDRTTGEAIHNAIVWQCRRTADYCEQLKQRGLAEYLQTTTGLIVDAYFSATKIQWLLEQIPGARERAERGDLRFGTIDSFLIWQLSGGRRHVTDYTNAARTMLFNLQTLQWDERLLREFAIPRAMLPEVVPSSGIAARCATPLLNHCPIPIAGLAGDQQAALFGQNCRQPGTLKNTYGTGCFMLMNTGGHRVRSNNGLLTTLNAQTRPGQPSYALEGSVFIGGALIQWLRDGLRILENAADSGKIAATVPDNGGVYLVPAFAGLGAPYWDMYARGTLVGLTRGTTREQLIRAADEAIAYQCRDLAEAMRQDYPHPLTALRADGGAVGDDFLLQFQADLLGIPVERPVCVESTALGAALLAAEAVGFAPAAEIGKTAKIFTPQMPPEKRERLYRDWKRAVERARHWAVD